jgi:murein DD-endopeptidase MepM/ murein hydrolase activator NlpD
MNRYLIRIVAVLLVSCLTGDPVVASIGPNLPSDGMADRHGGLPLRLFAQQAMSNREEFVGHPPGEGRRVINWALSRISSMIPKRFSRMLNGRPIKHETIFIIPPELQAHGRIEIRESRLTDPVFPQGTAYEAKFREIRTAMTGRYRPRVQLMLENAMAGIEGLKTPSEYANFILNSDWASVAKGSLNLGLWDVFAHLVWVYPASVNDQDEHSTHWSDSDIEEVTSQFQIYELLARLLRERLMRPEEADHVVQWLNSFIETPAPPAAPTAVDLPDPGLPERLASLRAAIDGFERTIQPTKDSLDTAVDKVLSIMREAGKDVPAHTVRPDPIQTEFIDLNRRFAEAWRSKKSSLPGYRPTTREEALGRGMHSNDWEAGLLPEDALGDREKIIRAYFQTFLPVASGAPDLAVTPENIHPAVFTAVVALNKLPGIRTTVSGPEVIGFHLDVEHQKDQEATILSAMAGYPIQWSTVSGGRIDLQLSSRTTLGEAKMIWDAFAARLSRAAPPAEEASPQQLFSRRVEEVLHRDTVPRNAVPLHQEIWSVLDEAHALFSYYLGSETSSPDGRLLSPDERLKRAEDVLRQAITVYDKWIKAIHGNRRLRSEHLIFDFSKAINRNIQQRVWNHATELCQEFVEFFVRHRDDEVVAIHGLIVIEAMTNLINAMRQQKPADAVAVFEQLTNFIEANSDIRAVQNRVIDVKLQGLSLRYSPSLGEEIDESSPKREPKKRRGNADRRIKANRLQKASRERDRHEAAQREPVPHGLEQMPGAQPSEQGAHPEPAAPRAASAEVLSRTPINEQTTLWTPDLVTVTPVNESSIPGFNQWVVWNDPVSHLLTRGMWESHFDWAAYLHQDGKIVVGLPEGAIVRAIADGRATQVLTASIGSRGDPYLHQITIEHGKKESGLCSVYLHVVPSVHKGEEVRQGQPIGVLYKDPGWIKGRLVHLELTLINGWSDPSDRVWVDPEKTIYAATDFLHAHPQASLGFRIAEWTADPVISIANFHRLDFESATGSIDFYLGMILDVIHLGREDGLIRGKAILERINTHLDEAQKTRLREALEPFLPPAKDDTQKRIRARAA